MDSETAVSPIPESISSLHAASMSSLQCLGQAGFPTWAKECLLVELKFRLRWVQGFADVVVACRENQRMLSTWLKPRDSANGRRLH